MNYGQLKTAVAGWANRSDLTSLMVTFLELTEQRIYQGTPQVQGLRLTSMLGTDSTVVTGDALPARFAAVERVTYLTGGRKQPLEQRAPQMLAILEGTSGQPRFYAIRGTTIVIAPGGASDTCEMSYYARLVTPVADGDTNDILTNSAGVYLHGMLVEVGNYLQDESMVALHEARFVAEMKQVQKYDDDKRYSGPITIVSDLSVRV